MQQAIRPLKLGSLLLKTNVLLSPLEAVSDVGFRHICAKNGAAFTFTEMIRAQAVARNNNSALDLIDTVDASTPTGLQLLAKSPDELTRALHRIEELANSTRHHYNNIRLVDLNFGCPSKDVINEGAGPSLLKRKKKIFEIFNALVQWKATTSLNIQAVGAKIRLGLNANEEKNKVYMGVVEAGNIAGLDYLTVHGRNAAQRSRDRVNWKAITEIKQIACMPIIGNGDIKTIEDIHQMYEETNVDGFMIARAAISNPWIFRVLNNSSITVNSLPSQEDLSTAIDAYSEWAMLSQSKLKFTDFHTANFARIGKNVLLGESLGNSSAQVYAFPKNKHLS